jgi:glycosyltransferase involved in cell wall biosynthesis
LDIESKLNKFSGRIKQLPYVTRDKHFENVASVDINIAPLEIGNPFCESKSELKFFEAGIVGVPTVATATQPFFEAIEDGIDGFVAADSEQWIEKLEKLIHDEELRRSMGENAREKALGKYTTINADNEEYYEYLRSKLQNTI